MTQKVKNSKKAKKIKDVSVYKPEPTNWDIYNNCDTFFAMMKDNNVKWESSKDRIVHLVHEPSGISVSFEDPTWSPVGYHTYMLNKLLDKL